MLEQIREYGYDSVTMGGVAATTRCGKSTLYRQWKTKPPFVAAALRARRGARFRGIDTGTLAGDLREVARRAGEGYALRGRVFQALGHAAVQDEELRTALRDALVEPEIDALRAMIHRAVDRGEVSADHPALEFIPARIFGVLRARPVLEGQDADETYTTKFIEAAVLPSLGLT